MEITTPSKSYYVQPKFNIELDETEEGKMAIVNYINPISDILLIDMVMGLVPILPKIFTGGTIRA